MKKTLNTAPSSDDIITETCRYFGVKEEDVRGPARTKEITAARQAAMHLVRTMIPQYSTTDIGQEFGGRDHSTVLYSLSQVETRIKKDAEFEQKIKQIKININSKK